MGLGLYGGGPVSGSFVARLPNLEGRLGPVASSCFRVASRIVNSLRAGYPVRDCAALEECRVLLVAVPDSGVDAAVASLAAAPVGWASKSVLLCGCGPGSRVLEPLRQRGAAAGSLSPIECPGARYVVEGDPPAFREARRLVRDLRGRAIRLDASAVPLYGAGLSLATALFTPLIAASVDALRAAGLNPVASAELAGALFQKTLRGWLHGGKKSWTGPLAAGDCAGVAREVDALARHDPRAAQLYRDAAAFALAYFDRHPELRKQL